MNDNITELSQSKKSKTNKKDTQWENLLTLLTPEESVLNEFAKTKFEQFTDELFLFFRNLEAQGLTDFKQLYDSFFKRLMALWMIVLPPSLDGVDLVKAGFERRLIELLEKPESISIIPIYKYWLKLWDQWVVKYRKLFIENFKKEPNL
ncbi:hypothetical protein L3V79_06690 [Thiotrichales bacterium 19S9-12]|nr:hypothetical protein [Thiotrichales bacterium 19S9-11]MCF6812041.1 hypothetical protein [Thiotrichales bacterium 19S9-12]